MTNNQLCNFIGAIGCIICFFSMGLMFFGMTTAFWGAVVGIGLATLGLVNYN